MTKRVRIENADTSDYKVIVQVWERGVGDEPHVMVFERELPHPCSMTGDDIYLTSTRYVVVREA